MSNSKPLAARTLRNILMAFESKVLNPIETHARAGRFHFLRDENKDAMYDFYNELLEQAKRAERLEEMDKPKPPPPLPRVRVQRQTSFDGGSDILELVNPESGNVIGRYEVEP